MRPEIVRRMTESAIGSVANRQPDALPEQQRDV